MLRDPNRDSIRVSIRVSSCFLFGAKFKLVARLALEVRNLDSSTCRSLKLNAVK